VVPVYHSSQMDPVLVRLTPDVTTSSSTDVKLNEDVISPPGHSTEPPPTTARSETFFLVFLYVLNLSNYL